MNKFKRVWLPIVWFLVACSTVIHFESNWETGRIFYDGFHTGALLAIIIAFVLIIRIFRRVEEILISKGTIKSRVSTPYDIFPVLLLIPFGIGAQWFGNLLPSAAAQNEVIYQWVFKWGQHEYKFLIYVAILGLLLLYRIHQILVAVTKQRSN